MQQVINKLLDDFEISDIECGSVQFFLDKNNVLVHKNILITDIAKKNNGNILKIKSFLQSKLNSFSINDLQKIFESLIPPKDRKINGAFFTPCLITDYITSELVKSDNQKICDPSCGCGAFLIAAIKFLNSKFNKSIANIIEDNIFGIDILDYSVRRCKIILSLLALVNKEDKESYAFNIRQFDSLNADWSKEFPLIMKNGGFDILVGNPPYVKYQDLSDKIRKELYENWRTLKTGTYNIYFAFFELGMKLLNAEGQLGYITPNNYFTSLAGIHLREFLQVNRYIKKIIDFNHLRLFDAQTYTCITFLSRTKRNYFLFDRIEKEKNAHLLKNCEFSKVNYDYLDRKKWRLLKEIDQINIKKIEALGEKLGTVVDIRVGIATCKDAIYFIDGQTLQGGYYKKVYDNETFLIEKAITKPIVKISDFKSQEELRQNTRRIIFPYSLKNGKAFLISRHELREKYPQCYNYLLAAKKELEGRDKGQVKYEEWYAYARTQGLTFFGEKLVTPTFSSKPRFLYIKDPETLFCNGYGIFAKKEPSSLFDRTMNLEILAKTLNSKIMAYYIDKTSVSIEGGYPCYQKNFIERFSSIKFDKNDLTYLEREKIQQKIDEFLVRKYEINI